MSIGLFSEIEKKQRHKCHLLSVRGASKERDGLSCRRNPDFGLIGFNVERRIIVGRMSRLLQFGNIVRKFYDGSEEIDTRNMRKEFWLQQSTHMVAQRA